MSLVSERDKCAHLLRRFGLGASEAEITYYLQDGLSGAIDRLCDFKSVDEGFGIDIDSLDFQGKGVRIQNVVNWWGARLLMTRHPLQEKMTLFWHDHFATSASKVQGAMMMYGQNEIFRRNAIGNFRTLLTEVSKDPAMIFWLDNQENVKGHANENFAREVMELFTLGIGHYTEKDIQESARAFTGWSFNRSKGKKIKNAEFAFREAKHDNGIKTFLGNKSDFTGEDILNILCDQERTAEFLTTKIWDWFVWSKPDPETIAPFARKFHQSGLDIQVLLKAIMKSPEFYSDKAARTLVKNPADFCVTTLRQLGVGSQMRDSLKGASGEGEINRAAFSPAGATLNTMKGMGMWLMYPPDVSGWTTGQAWITSATMVERIAWGDRIFGQARGVKYSLRYPAYGLFEKDLSPTGVVNKLVSVFDAPVKPERLPILRSAAQKASAGRITPENANATAAAVTRLIFATPEFQFA